MKHFVYAALFAMVAFSCDNDDPQPVSQGKVETVNLSLGVRYANDIYYSLKNGEVSAPVRAEWDIAFYTNPMTSTIITNDGSGVELYVWPNGTKADWASVDTAGLSQIVKLYNTYSDTTWEKGAFDKGALGHPDYGWGVYNMNTHTLTGDSIHIIKLIDGSFRKLLIEKREASTNTYYIKFANIDGTNEQSAQIPCGNHLDKNFIHFSIVSNQVVVHEPALANWDLVFTKYYDESIPYIVTGVLANNDIWVAETDTVNTNYSGASYSKVLNVIGSDWKVLNNATYTYYMKENVAYFVKDRDGNYYRLKFTSFAGSSTGNLSFEKTTY